jgi:hypothetical protein
VAKATSDKSAAIRTCRRYTDESSFQAATIVGYFGAWPHQRPSAGGRHALAQFYCVRNRAGNDA